MMYRILGVVALLCMQVINANSSKDSENNCTKELAELRANATEFFKAFQPQHNESTQFVKVIDDLYGIESGGLQIFTAKNYGEKLSCDQLQSEIKMFADGFFLIEQAVWNHVHRIELKVFLFNEIISCFKKNNNLKCHSSKSTSCQAELSKLRCDLNEFFKSVDNGFDKALHALDGIINVCETLSRITRNFYTNNQLSCGTYCSSSDNEMRKNVKSYIALYNPLHNTTFYKIGDIASSCNALLVDINAWQVRLS